MCLSGNVFIVKPKRQPFFCSYRFCSLVLNLLSSSQAYSQFGPSVWGLFLFFGGGEEKKAKSHAGLRLAIALKRQVLQLIHHRHLSSLAQAPSPQFKAPFPTTSERDGVLT